MAVLGAAARTWPQAASWTPRGAVSSALVANRLRAEGREPNDLIRDYVAAFDGFRSRTLPPSGFSFIELDILAMLAREVRGDRPFIDAVLGEPICPIGFGSGNDLYLAPGGSVLFLNDQWLAYGVASDLGEAWDVILGYARVSRGGSLSKDQVPLEFRG